jgi:hypothetical protein
VINKFKMAKHFEVAIGENTLSVSRQEDAIAAEAVLDGIYVLRTTIKESDLDAPGVVDAYKALSHVERDFRHLKIDDIDLRPIHHRLEARVRSHVFICMLASYLVWHLRETLAPLTFTDEAPPAARQPGRSGQRSAGARAKAAAKENDDGQEVRGFRELSSTWARSRATPCGPRRRPRASSSSSPLRLPRSVGPSNCSAHRCRSSSCSQNNSALPGETPGEAEDLLPQRQ